MEKLQERKLLRMMARHGVAELYYSNADQSISLEIEADLHPEIVCRQAGVFLHRHPADGSTGRFPRNVRKGDIVAYLKAGAILVPVIASDDGWLPQPLLDDGEVAGYGDVLF
jgi:hypothetical protein